MYYVVCELQEGIIDEFKTDLNRLTLKLMCSLLKQHFPRAYGRRASTSAGTAENHPLVESAKTELDLQ